MATAAGVAVGADGAVAGAEDGAAGADMAMEDMADGDGASERTLENGRTMTSSNGNLFCFKFL